MPSTQRRLARGPSLALVLFALAAPPVAATTYNGNPSNYLTLLAGLQPGDTLLLAAGTYTSGLTFNNRHGQPGSPIVVAGPETGAAAVFRARGCCNTVSITDSSYLEIRNLELDGLLLDGDAVKAEGPNGDANFAHHITIENLFIHGHDASQQTVGISTKCPAWDWVIRRNVIASAGTGLYLGNSDGSAPFVNGLIEGNLVLDTIGYNVQIKHQNNRPALPGMPSSGRTIVRHNVLSKVNNASTGSDARPNLLVGHWPLSGAGATDFYAIYGNFLWANPTGEPLFQGEGNVAFYDNLLVNNTGPGLWVQPHEDVPREVRIFNNTVVASTTCIRVTGGAVSTQQKVIGNAVFAATPISAADQAGNVTGTFAGASTFLQNPGGNPAVPSTLDLYPRAGTLAGPALDRSSFNTFPDWDRDFNGLPQNGLFRGAYGAEGSNPGWRPALERKPLLGPSLVAVSDVVIGRRSSPVAAVFTVSVSPPSLVGVSATFATANDTAVAGVDYVAAAGPLSIPPGSLTGTVTVTVNAAAPGPPKTFVLNLSGITGGVAVDTQAQATLTDPGFYTVTPCRVADTREPVSAPALVGGAARSIAVGGTCGVPVGAAAVSANVAVTAPTAPGFVSLFAAGTPTPFVSSLNYGAGQTRANNAVVPLGPAGAVAILCGQALGTTHFLLDVNGYFVR